MITCARCKQPIEAGQLYHGAHRAGTVTTGDGTHTITVSDGEVNVHDYPCPTRIGPPDSYAAPGAQTCCGGGPQWGHAWDCRTLP